jgi:hypothetical protein
MVAIEPEYDLSLRAPASSLSYRCSDVFHILDDSGRPTRSEQRSADVVVETVGDQGGAPRVRWTYSGLTLAVDGEPADEPDAAPPSGEIVFEGVSEDEDSYIPPIESF